MITHSPRSRSDGLASEQSKSLRGRWTHIIQEHDRSSTLEKSERGNQLWQVSQLAILPAHQARERMER